MAFRLVPGMACSLPVYIFPHYFLNVCVCGGRHIGGGRALLPDVRADPPPIPLMTPSPPHPSDVWWGDDGGGRSTDPQQGCGGSKAILSYSFLSSKENLVMSLNHEDFQGLHEDTNEGPPTHSWIPQGILINKWIPSPLSRLNCSPLTLLLGFLITILFFTVIITQVRVTKEVMEVKTSVDRILSDEVTGALSNGIEKILGVLSENWGRENGTSKNSSVCGSGWHHKNDSCYYFGWVPQMWKYAKKACEDRKAHLVVITSEAEMKFLRDLSYMESVWIGLVSDNGSWKWVDGTSYEKNPKFWWKGQPDNWFGHGLEGGEDCAQLTDGDGWTDVHCTLLFPYMCEKEVS